MANGPTHPNEQLRNEDRPVSHVNGSGSARKNNRSAAKTKGAKTDKDAKKMKLEAESVVGPHEQLLASTGPIAQGSGPIGPHEQGVTTVGAEPVNSPPPPPPSGHAAKAQAKGLDEAAYPASSRLRFTVRLQARLAKDTELAVGVSVPKGDRTSIAIESLHLQIFKKGKMAFQTAIPLRSKDSKVKAGAKKLIPLAGTQRKELSSIVQSKTIAVVDAVYTAPVQTLVRISIEDAAAKK